MLQNKRRRFDTLFPLAIFFFFSISINLVKADFTENFNDCTGLNASESTSAYFTEYKVGYGEQLSVPLTNSNLNYTFVCNNRWYGYGYEGVFANSAGKAYQTIDEKLKLMWFTSDTIVTAILLTELSELQNFTSSNYVSGELSDCNSLCTPGNIYISCFNETSYLAQPHERFLIANTGQCNETTYEFTTYFSDACKNIHEIGFEISGQAAGVCDKANFTIDDLYFYGIGSAANSMPTLTINDLKSVYCFNESDYTYEFYLNVTDEESDTIYYATDTSSIFDVEVYTLDDEVYTNAAFDTVLPTLGPFNEYMKFLACNVLGTVDNELCRSFVYSVEAKDLDLTDFEYTSMNYTDSFNTDYCIYKDFDNETFYRIGLNGDLCPNTVLGYSMPVIAQSDKNYFFDVKLANGAETEVYPGFYYYAPLQMDKIILNRTGGYTEGYQDNVLLFNTSSDLIRFNFYFYYNQFKYDLQITDRLNNSLVINSSLEYTHPLVAWINFKLKKGLFSVDNIAVWEAATDFNWMTYSAGSYVNKTITKEGLYPLNIYLTDSVHTPDYDTYSYSFIVMGDCDNVVPGNITTPSGQTIIEDSRSWLSEGFDNGNQIFDRVFWMGLFIGFIICIILVKNLEISLIITGGFALLISWLMSGNFMQMISSATILGVGITILLLGINGQ